MISSFSKKIRHRKSFFRQKSNFQKIEKKSENFSKSQEFFFFTQKIEKNFFSLFLLINTQKNFERKITIFFKK